MAKLYFYYSAMNAGKSTMLLQSAYNYKERGMDTLLFTPEIDNRHEKNKIYSRIGLEADAVSFDKNFNFFEFTKNSLTKNPKLKCIFIDEAQFLNKEQVSQLSDIVDFLELPVLAYGIRTDFQGKAFPGSIQLLLWADNIIELKTICFCGKKAIMNARIDQEGKIITTGDQIQIGGNESYIAMCRKHFKETYHLLDSKL